MRLLIIGCGDIGCRTLKRLGHYQRIYALARTGGRAKALRDLGVTPIMGDLDYPKSLGRLAGLANHVLHLAPPQNSGIQDKRTKNLLAALNKSIILPQRLIYISTSGVYGDCQGRWVAESEKIWPRNARAVRRADAEKRLRQWGRFHGVGVSILRVPGIYADERLPIERLKKGVPAVCEAEDSYSNHIHAEDLARVLVAALQRGRPNRIYNVCDNLPIKMGDYFDLVADYFHLPRAPRLSKAETLEKISPALASFLNESRRLSNKRMRKELRVHLSYESVASYFKEMNRHQRAL